jgi:hypothetical protein
MFKVGFTRGDAEELALQFNDELVNPAKNRWADDILDPSNDKRLFLHDLSGSQALEFTDKEEVFASNLAELMPDFGADVKTLFGRKVPTAAKFGIRAATLPVRVTGKGVRRSELMYGTYLNQIRSKVATTTLDQWDKAQRETGRQIERADIDALVDAVNVFTGRGNLPFNLDRIAHTLTGLFWAPRLAISRFEAPLIAGRGIVEAGAGAAARLTGANEDSLLSRVANSPGARARKRMAADLVEFTATGMTILAALDKFGVAEVEIDPRSSDFGKGRIGDLRFDFLLGS